MNGAVRALFGDAAHDFKLTIGGAEELEEKCNAGIPLILRRIVHDEARIKDIRETIRLGLVGGGMAPEQALLLVDRYAQSGLGRLKGLAIDILGCLWFGVEHDPPPKSRPRGKKKPAPLGKTGEPSSASSTNAAE